MRTAELPVSTGILSRAGASIIRNIVPTFLPVLKRAYKKTVIKQETHGYAGMNTLRL